MIAARFRVAFSVSNVLTDENSMRNCHRRVLHAAPNRNAMEHRHEKTSFSCVIDHALWTRIRRRYGSSLRFRNKPFPAPSLWPGRSPAQLAAQNRDNRAAQQCSHSHILRV